MKMQAPFIASNLALAQSKEKVIGWAITFWYNTQVGISIHWKKKLYFNKTSVKSRKKVHHNMLISNNLPTDHSSRGLVINASAEFD